MDEAVRKFENPARVRELQIDRVLDALDFCPDGSICDVGAGTGLFSVAAAARTAGTVYAMDISDAMLEILRKKAEEKGLKNMSVRKVEGPLPARDGCCRACLLATVYHELSDRAAMTAEILRVLEPGGRLGVIEFLPGRTPMGPPPEHRVPPETLKNELERGGFRQASEETLGENLFFAVFQKHKV
jgi:ubiquinone/menaquinone biosynthesis C-methylase UbiE